MHKVELKYLLIPIDPLHLLLYSDLWAHVKYFHKNIVVHVAVLHTYSTW